MPASTPRLRIPQAARAAAALLVLGLLPGMAAVAEPRRNLADFDFVTARVAANYSGWPGKTAGARGRELEALTARLRGQAAGDDSAFRAAVDDWLAWFDDGHLRARWAAPVREVAWSEPRRPMDETAVRARLDALASARAPVEGLWAIDDRYRLAVLRRDRATTTFDAIVLSTAAERWAPGDVKAVLVARPDGRFDVRYGAGDRTELAVRAELYAEGHVLDLGELGLWRRLPGDRAGVEPSQRWPGDDFAMRRLDARTLYLRLPSFNDRHADTVRSLVAAHADELARTPRLVVDVRGNGGGSDFVYDPVLPFVASGPVRRVGVEIRVSGDNARLRREVGDRLAAVSAEAAATLREESNRMADARTAFIRREPAEEWVPVDRPSPMPRRVVVLVDRAASSAESFLLDARQSTRVVLMGQENSAGVLDFGETMEMPAPSGRFDLVWATTRSLRLPGEPVDPDGIAPSVRIPAEVDNPLDWVLQWLDREHTGLRGTQRQD